MKIPFDIMKKILGDCFSKAKDVLQDPKKIKALLDAAEEKFKKVPYIGDKLSNIPILFSMLYSYVRKEYTDISTKSLLTIIATLIYLVSPIDIIIDKIPIIGMIDDAAVLSFCYSNITPDIEKYKKWKDKKEQKGQKVKKNRRVGARKKNSERVIEKINK